MPMGGLGGFRNYETTALRCTKRKPLKLGGIKFLRALKVEIGQWPCFHGRN